MAKTRFSILGFSYQHFSRLGSLMGRAFYSNDRSKLEKTLDDTGLRIYPEAYFSLIGLIFLISIFLTIVLILITGVVFLAPAPLLVILLGYTIPKTIAHDRASKLDLEVPFAGTYISVMATGGLSPYASLKRLRECSLLPNVQKVVKDLQIDVEIKGLDPVTAMEESAQNLPSKDYKDLMLGYSSTMRTGGDVLHYLLIRTETMYKDLAIKVKAFGERASMLMESYITISILMTLLLTVMYMTSLSFQGFWQGDTSASTFLIYGYFIVPIVAMLFVFISDSQQVSLPLNDWRIYKTFIELLPIPILLALTMFVPFAAPDLTLPFAYPFMNFIIWLRQTLGLVKGYEAGLGIGVVLLVTSIIGSIINSYYNRKTKGIEQQVTAFMRDLTEARKTGSSPERCMENLSKRNYGGFSPILTTASRQIRWGLPFKVIYETCKTKLNSWLPLINLYVLVDAIEVGGGTPETLETLTHFSEELSSLEKEKKATLRPLLIMPYIGAGILILSTLVFMSFSKTILVSYSHQTIPYSQVVTLLLPALMIQVFFTGIVTGKLSGGNTASGFKHAMILTIIALVLIPIAGILTIPFISG